MTVLCLVEQDGDGVADASQCALTLAAALAGPAGPSPAADAADGAQPARPADEPAGPAAAVAPVGPAESLAAVVFAAVGPAPVAALAAFGVPDVYVVESAELTAYAPAAWARSLAGLAAAPDASTVVAAATDRGNEVMAHLAAMTGLPMAANCVSAAREPAGPDGRAACRIVRQRWGGSLLEDAVLDAWPALLTVAADAVAAPPAAGPGAARVYPRRPALEPADLVVQASASAGPAGAASLATARVVVGGGRGVGGPEGFGPLDELAGLLGAAVGVSRVVTSLGWRPHKQQVGQTGTRITPRLYLACGISGAIQHMAGCGGAEHIIAINTDPGAPIVSRADYAVIGDLKEVIPALVAAIRARSAAS